MTASISIADAVLTEGDSGSVNLDFTLTRSGDLAPEIVLSYTTLDGTAAVRPARGVSGDCWDSAGAEN